MTHRFPCKNGMMDPVVKVVKTDCLLPLTGVKCESNDGRGRCHDLLFHEWRDLEGLPMLVLSRKLGEKVIIGEDIVLTVVKIDRNQIRLGIEAPKEIPVYRDEICPKKRQDD